MPRDTILADVFAEQRRAKAKHGDKYVVNLPERNTDTDDGVVWAAELQMMGRLTGAGDVARVLCDNGEPTKVAVLVEEVAEVVDALLKGEDPTDELVQVAAMALAWLGIEDAS